MLRGLERVWVIGIAGIGEISAAGAQQFLDLVDCLASDAARLALLNVAVEFDEGPIGAGLHGFSCPIGHGRKQSKAFLERGVIANRVHGHGIYLLSVSLQVTASAVVQPP